MTTLSVNTSSSIGTSWKKCPQKSPSHVKNRVLAIRFTLLSKGRNNRASLKAGNYAFGLERGRRRRKHRSTKQSRSDQFAVVDSPSIWVTLRGNKVTHICRTIRKVLRETRKTTRHVYGSNRRTITEEGVYCLLIEEVAVILAKSPFSSCSRFQSSRFRPITLLFQVELRSGTSIVEVGHLRRKWSMVCGRVYLGRQPEKSRPGEYLVV